MLASLSGNQLSLAADTPTLCHAFVAKPEALGLVEASGCPPARRLLVYRDDAELRDRCAEAADNGWRIACNHGLPVEMLPAASLWIDRDLFVRLNDKATLHEIVDASLLPERRVVDRLDGVRAPAVIKVAGPGSTGAGIGVRVCREDGEIARASAEIGSATRLIVEELLDIVGTWCVQFIVDPGGVVHDLGSAEQVTGDDGAWHGNWLDTDPPQELLDACRDVTRRSAALGYRGVVGIDAVVTRDGAQRILEGNFRFNGSTVALLYRDAIGAPVLRSRGFRFEGDPSAFERTGHDAIERGLMLVRGASVPDTGAPLVSALVPGDTREHVAERIDGLARLGFS